MKKALFTIGILLISMLPIPLFATTQVVQLPIADRSSQSLQDGVRLAMQQALTSMDQSIDTKQLVSKVEDPLQYVQSYSYERPESDSVTTSLPWLLQVTFDKEALQQLSDKTEQSPPLATIKSPGAPLTVAWVRVQNNVLDGSDNSDLTKALMTEAKRQQVALILPSMDLQDQQVWGAATGPTFDLPRLNQLQKRYAASHMLAGHVFFEDQKWHGQWLFVLGDEPMQWFNQADSASALLEKAVDQFALLANHQWVMQANGNQERQYTLEIFGIGDLNEYVKVMHVLQASPAVRAVSVKDMASNSLLIALTSNKNHDQLMQALLADAHFREVPKNPLNGLAQADVYLQWQDDSPSQAMGASQPDNSLLERDAGVSVSTGQSIPQPNAERPETTAKPADANDDDED